LNIPHEDLVGHFEGRSTSNGSHLESSKQSASDRSQWKEVKGMGGTKVVMGFVELATLWFARTNL